MSNKKQPSDIDDLFSLVENNLIKKDSMFVLSSGRLVSCYPKNLKRETGSSQKNPISVSGKSGDIIVWHDRLMKFDKCFRFWLLCFAWHRFNSDSDIVSDAFATLKYKEYGCEMRLLFPNFIETIRYAPTDSNRERLKQLQLQFLKPKNK